MQRNLMMLMKNKICWEAPTEGTPAAVEPVVEPAPAPVEGEANPSLISGAPAPEGKTPPEGEAKPDAAPPEPFVAATAETLADYLPEGFDLADGASDALLEAINSSTTPQELTKNLAGLYAAEVAKFQTAMAETWTATQTEWQDAIRNDPAFSGDKLSPALAQAKEIALQLGGDEFLTLLDATGMGNNVVALRALLKARELIPQEGTPTNGRPAAQPKTLAQKLFNS